MKKLLIISYFFAPAAKIGAVRWTKLAKYLNATGKYDIDIITGDYECAEDKLLAADLDKVGNVIRGDFGLFYQIPRDIGLLYPTTDIIDTYVYRGLRAGQLGISSAVGLFQSVVGLIMVLTTNAIVKKIDSDNAMF